MPWLKISTARKTYADVSERTFRAWIAQGLPVSRPPVGPALVCTDDIDEFLRQYRGGGEVDIDALVESALKDGR